jgi:hypothetical protein
MAIFRVDAEMEVFVHNILNEPISDGHEGSHWQIF